MASLSLWLGWRGSAIAQEQGGAAASFRPEDCGDLVALETPAMTGALGADLRGCLEGRMALTTSRSTRGKISRVLIQDAAAREDKAEWGRLMERHLLEIDASDPDMCFSYALHLSRGGAARAPGVITWAEAALENQQQWAGASAKRKVYALYKLRAEAAHELWRGAAGRLGEGEAEVDRYREMTTGYAREWLDYARSTAQSTGEPLSLCVRAAGSARLCEG